MGTNNNLLRWARVQAGFTQEDLAEMLDVSCMTVYRWESGQRTPDLTKRTQIGLLLGKKAEELGWPECEEKPPITGRTRLVDPLVPLEQSILLGQQALLNVLQPQCIKVRTTGLIGLPGCGKTAVAVAVATAAPHQFSGVLWASVGQRSNPRRHFRRWASLLGIEAIPEDVEEAKEVLRTVIEGRRFLIVLDDLWSANDWSAYHVGGRCHYLLTTRQVSLAYQICDSVYRPQQLTTAQAMHLLSRGLPPFYRHKHRLALQRIAEQWKLPLAMNVAATYLCHEASTDSPRRIRNAIEQLSHPEFIFHLNSCSSEQSVAVAIQQSEQWLPEPAQRALSCLATHFPVAPTTFSEAQADQVLQQHHLKIQDLDLVADAGLVEIIGKGEYQLHPAIAAYARFKASTGGSGRRSAS